MKNWLIYVASSFIILESKCMVYSRANVLKKKKNSNSCQWSSHLSEKHSSGLKFLCVVEQNKNQCLENG